MPVDKFRTEKCKILAYNKETKELDVNFLGYGIRLYEVKDTSNDTVEVKYKGKIGTSDFICKL